MSETVPVCSGQRQAGKQLNIKKCGVDGKNMSGVPLGLAKKAFGWKWSKNIEELGSKLRVIRGCLKVTCY